MAQAQANWDSSGTICHTSKANRPTMVGSVTLTDANNQSIQSLRSQSLHA